MTKFTLMFSDSFVVKLYMFLQALLSNLFPTMFTFNLGLVDLTHVVSQYVLTIKLPTDGAADFNSRFFLFSLMDKLDVISEDGLPGKHLPTLIALGSIILLLPLMNTSNVFP